MNGSLGQGFFKWTVFIFGIFISQTVLAYVPTITASGAAIRWKGPVKLNLTGNPINQTGISEDQFFSASVMGLQRWHYASDNVIQFDYWQGTNSKLYPTNSEYNGISSIYFASAGQGDVRVSSNVLGMTQVWYNTNSGEILETDIVLNDKDFNFTNNPTDTSGYGSGTSRSGQGKSNVYIQNVITHELGHAFGLSHSGGLQSTMLFMESPEQAHLGCDELVAIHALYPFSDQSKRASISGQVVSESGKPVFGAHVLAISQRRGTVLATAMSDRDGNYLLSALEPGTYYIMAEPFYAGSQALPAYYSEYNPIICPEENTFSRGFLVEAESVNLIPVQTEAPRTSKAPTLTVQCRNSGGASVARLVSSNSNSSEPTIDFNSRPDNSFGIVDQLSPPLTQTYRLKNVSGKLQIHAVSYSLYSPVRAILSLYSGDGGWVDAKISDPVYQGDSGYVNHDTSLLTEELPPGDYILRVTASRLQANDYPAGPISLDSIPFLVLTGALNPSNPPLSTTLPTNARCRLAENFPNYQSPPGEPSRSQPKSDSSGGGCGSIHDRSNNSDSNHQGPLPSSEVLAWFLPWSLVLFAWRILIRLQRKSRPVNLKG
jgi:hypothetical protein